MVSVFVLAQAFSMLHARSLVSKKVNASPSVASKTVAGWLAKAPETPAKRFLAVDSAHLDQLTDDEFLERMQYDYTRKCLEKKDSLCTIENDGFRISLFCVAVKNGWIRRDVAAAEVLQYLREFHRAKTARGIMPRTFERQTGEKAKVEYWAFGRPYDVVGTAFMAATLQFVVGPFFQKRNAVENEIRQLSGAICDRIDWNFAYDAERKCFTWFKNGDDGSRFDGKELLGEMDETFFLQLLVLGAKKWSYGLDAYNQYVSKIFIDSQYGYRYYGTKEYNYKETGNLKYMQINNPEVLGSKDYPMAKLGYLVQPHIWFDLRGSRDDFCRKHHMDYFQSVQNAIKAQMEYARRNPGKFPHYGQLWGFYDTYSPSLKSGIIKGLPAEGDIDEGSISVDAVMAAVEFMPKEAIACLRALYKLYKDKGIYTSKGWVTSVDTRSGDVAPFFWDSFFPPLNVLLIENYRSELIWKLAKSTPEYLLVFSRAGFGKASEK